MLKKFIKDFKKLPESNKSMIYLMWIYGAGWIIGSLFVNIYVFSFNKEILDVLYYNTVFLTSVLIWFSLIWLIFSIYKKNIKNMYYMAYSAYILAFILLFIFNWYLWIYLFAVIFWLGFWMFRCAVHTQELVNIEDKTRDIYSSIISGWKNIIDIIMPFIISGIFFVVSLYFSFSPYLVLFTILPIIYLTSFFFIKNIWDYVPSKIKKKDVKNFFNLKKYLFGQLYFIFVWLYQGLFWTIPPIIAIILLKSEINVWLFEWVITFISTFLVIFVATKRKRKNRIKFMWILSVLLFINLSIFSYNFNIYWYIIFTLIGLLLNPLYRISEHVFDLKLMDTIKVKWSDFYPAMILREISLWVWRVSILFLFIYLVKIWLGTDDILKIALISIWIFLILAWWSIALHIKYENKWDK